MQNEAPSLQCLLSSHNPEQQSPFSLQSLPPVLQLPFSGVQSPSDPHVPPQQASFLEHAFPSDMHCSAEHWPATQLSEQQSVLAEQVAPALAQTAKLETQPSTASQAPEQHSAPP